MECKTLVKTVIEAKSMDKRKKGRPRKDWNERIGEIEQERGRALREMKKLAVN